VEKHDGSREAKRRLEVILETMAGERTVGEACEALGISETHFHDLRSQALEGALEALEPGQPGRPRREVSEKDQAMAALEAELRELRLELRASQVREEIAAVMPHLLKGGKKTPRG